MKKLYAFSSLLFALLTGYVSQAQLAVNSTDITAVSLAQSLVGDGVTVVSATLVCPDGASGIFSNGNTTNLGIQNGILLTSGSAQGAVGPNDLGSFSASNGGAGDADLNALVAPFTTNNACYLEITFVPAGELIVFNYVFGSEEYNEYVCSNFNDVFAFFVNGPGYDNENIALIPGTLRPVTINNLNNGTPGGFAVSGNCDDVNFLFSDFFVDNFGGTTIQYDGFTTQLTANLSVVPDQEYTIKLAIADVSDAVFDSGVFIESESFISVDVVCDAGELFFEQYSTDELEFCLSDVPMGVTINNNSAGDNDNYVYLVTDEDLNILEILNTNLLNLETWTPGTYLVWGFSYGGNAVGLQVGENAADIEATICQALSNSLTVVINDCGCNANGGEISTQSPTTAFCKSDAEDDIFVIDLEGAVGENMTYVVTWANGEIFLISDNNTFNLSGIPGNGVCLFWHLSWNGEIFGAEIGANAFEIEGDCFDLSNPIEVQEWFANGGTISTEDETTFCVGDGEDDIVNVTLSNTNGANGQQTAWVITDGDLNILDLPAGPPFNFEGAGPGACIIWHLGWVGELNGAEVGANAADLSGDCFQLSNPITVTRIDCNPCPVDGGTISTESPLSFCKSDDEEDIFVVDLEGAVGENMTYVVTWANGVIFLISDNNTFNLSGIPGNGVCLFWHLSWNGEIFGAEIGENAFEIEGDCFDLSNPIEVQEWFSNGGTISTEDETTFCVGDGEDDIVDVTLSNTNGANGQQTAWVITDGDLNILDLPAGPPFNFEGAGPGACIIWHLGWVGELNGAEVGANAADLSGDCFQLSNPITVTRIDCNPCPVDGGTISTESPLSFCKSDDEEDIFVVDLEGAVGENMTYVVTWANGEIFLISDNNTFNLSGIPGNGVCLFWHLSWNGEIFGAEIGENAFEIEGDCFDLSNPIEVQEWFSNGGTISTEDETTFCVGDGEDDIVNVTLSNTNGANGQQTAWVITDGDLNILDLPAGPPFNFEGAGPGACIIWHLGWVGELNGAEVGANAADLSGDCFQLSNPITVTRIDCNPCPVDGGEISTQSPTTAFCKSDGEDDIFVIDLEGAVGDNMTYLVTWANGEIFMITEENTFDLEGIPGNGICIFWHLSWNGEINGLELGQNAFELEGDCFDLSNGIEVQEWFANGGTISTEDETTFCVGDGEDDIVNVTLSNTNGANGQQTAWVITDGDLNILDLPAGPPFNFEGAGPGACIIWHLGWVGELNGAEVGANAADLSGDCFQLSNPITVTRIDCEGSVDGCFGVEVLQYVQGTKLNGTPLDVDRTDPSKALGEPDRVNAPGGFVSLGYGGSISIIFDGAVQNLPGDDIQVWETSFSSDNCLSDGIESAHIELSQNGFTWIPAGTLCRDGAIDIAVTGLNYIIGIKIINDAASTTFDGYDVDGVEAINGCISIPEIVTGNCYATEVLQYEQGTRSDGGVLPVTRTDETRALGEPERTDANVFVTLGYGGSLVVAFDGSIPNQPGDDIEVVETSFNNPGCASYPEYANVYLSQNGVNFYFAKTICKGDGFVDIDDAGQGFTFVNFVKLVNNDTQTTTPDGFDVDGIVAIHNCTEDDSEGDGIVLLPASATIGVLSSSPNPAVGESVVVFRTAKSGPATLEVFDMSGRNMETLLNQVVEANQEYTLRFNTSGHANGIYLYRLSSADNVIIEKFMILR